MTVGNPASIGAQAEAERSRAARDELTASVVVCAYTLERLALTVGSVRSALGQTPRPNDVVLVVDHNDLLAERLRRELRDEIASRTLTVVPNEGRRGLSGARNSGIAAASGEVVAFLDDDALAEPGWIGALLDAFTAPDVLGAGGLAHPVWSGGSAPAWFPAEYHWVVGCSYEGMTRRGPVRNVLGCNMAFRRDLLVELGGFDGAVGRVGTLPVGCEETELCIRARRARPGGRIVALEEAVVRHHVSADRRSPRYFLRRCYHEGRSKAVLLGLSDGEAVASERAYATRTLPRAFARALADGLGSHRPRASLGRALAIGGGLVAAGIGFVHGLLIDRLGGRPAETVASPIPERPSENAVVTERHAPGFARTAR